MEYLNQADGKTYNQGQIRKMHPNMSLPRVWAESVCEVLGITPVAETPKPQPTSLTKIVVRDGTTIDALGHTVQAWAERDMFSDYTDENDITVTKAEQEADYLEKLKKDKKSQMKQQRDAEISTTTSVTVPSGTYEIDCNQVARSNLHQSIDNAEIAGLTDTDTTTWKMADNLFYEVTYGELKLMGLQIAQFIQTQYAKEAAKYIEIETATFETIEGIEW